MCDIRQELHVRGCGTSSFSAEKRGLQRDIDEWF